MDSNLSPELILIVAFSLVGIALLWYFFIYKLDKDVQNHKLQTIKKKLERIEKRKLEQQNKSKSDKSVK
jgi:F0F1-type ATP synthase membrane subunit b/b'